MENINKYYDVFFYDIDEFVDFFINKVKLYLKIDFEDEDEILKVFINASISSLENITSCKFNQFEVNELARVELYLLAYVSQAYNNRSLTVKENEFIVNRMFSSILSSLRYKKRGE